MSGAVNEGSDWVERVSEKGSERGSEWVMEEESKKRSGLNQCIEMSENK